MQLVRTYTLTATLALGLLAFGAAADEPLSLKLLSDQLDPSELEGHVVYVDFWASWCAPCLKSFPWMAEIQTAHQEDGLVILAINVDSEAAAAKRFLSKHEVPFRILQDPEGKLAAAFDVQAMPTSFAFDRSGQLAWKHEGFRDADTPELREKLGALLDVHVDDEDGAQ